MCCAYCDVVCVLLRVFVVLLQVFLALDLFEKCNEVSFMQKKRLVTIVYGVRTVITTLMWTGFCNLTLTLILLTVK